MATLITFVDGTIPVAADFNENFQALNAELAALSSTVLTLRAQTDAQVRGMQEQDRVIKALCAQTDEQVRVIEAVCAQRDEQARVIEAQGLVIGDLRRERRAED